MAACLFVPLLLEAAVTRTWKASLEEKKKAAVNSTQILSIHRIRFFFHALIPTSSVQAAPATSAQLPAKGLGLVVGDE